MPEDVSAVRLDIASLRLLLSSVRFRLQREEDLQEGIAQAFEAAGVAFEREARLSLWDRVDFLVNGVALEVKVAGSLRSVAAQLVRYAACDRVRGVLLVTTKAQLGFLEGLVGKSTPEKPRTTSDCGSDWIGAVVLRPRWRTLLSGRFP